MKRKRKQVATARFGEGPSENAAASSEDSDFVQRLSDEYKILQDKIDKIGAFRFTIKGWSVTVVIAAGAAGANTTSLLATVLVSTGAAIMLWFFFKLELEQLRLSRMFGNRAGRLEQAFEKVARGEGKEARARTKVPYTAHEVALGQEITVPTHRKREAKKRAWAQEHFGFYITLILISVLSIGPKHAAIYRKTTEMRNWVVCWVNSLTEKKPSSQKP